MPRGKKDLPEIVVRPASVLRWPQRAAKPRTTLSIVCK